MLAAGLLLMSVFGAAPEAEVVLVIGAAGSEEYGQRFAEWGSLWETAAKSAGAEISVIGRDGESPDQDKMRLQSLLKKNATFQTPLWLILIGHGTFDRREAKFNLRGPDFSAKELKLWLEETSRSIAIIDTSAASAPFLQTLAGPGRIVISATKSGGEQNFPYFGGYLSQAMGDRAADLDKDERVSLWEAYLFASRRTDEFYKLNGRLQTEHALLDDNGDGQGTRSDAFEGLEPRQQAAEVGKELDGLLAHQWHLGSSVSRDQLTPAQKDRQAELEHQIQTLKRNKTSLAERVYYEQLEILLIELAQIFAPRPVE